MRDNLPKNGSRTQECGVVNLDKGNGTHWVANRRNVNPLCTFTALAIYHLPVSSRYIFIKMKKHCVQLLLTMIANKNSIEFGVVICV